MKTMTPNWGFGRALLPVALLCTVAVVHLKADEQVFAGLDIPMKLNGVVNASNCDNSGGPQVTLEGDLVLGGMKLRLILQNNDRGTHKTSVITSHDVALVNDGDSITIPKQPVRGGAGGNPHIWLQFHDGQGSDYTEETYLGRCVQGLEVSADLINQAIAAANIATEGCRNHPGPIITLDGGILLSGLHARFIFRNNLRGTHTAEETADVTIIGGGTAIEIPKQPVQGGVGGNPIISVQFLDADCEPVTEAVELGRCNKI